MITAHSVEDFSQLPIPFLCLATDIETGEVVVLNSGFLPEAVRASMSIPSMFTPMEYQGRLLVDGGLVRNFPVSDCRRLGADFIIGIDVGEGLRTREELNSLVKVMEQSISFQGASSTEREQRLCDILIQPDVENYAITDFHRADSLIVIGESAARKAARQLAELTLKIPPHQTRDTVNHNIERLYISKIKFSNLRNVSKHLVTGNMSIKEKSWVTIQEIDKDISRIYGSRYFERVIYKLELDKKGYILNIIFTEKNTRLFRFGIHYDSDMKAAVLLNATMRNLVFQGSKLSVDLKMGDTNSFRWREYIHTGWKPGFGLGWDIIFDRFSFDYRDASGNKLARFTISNSATIINLGTIFTNQFSAGTTLEVRRVQTVGDIVPEEWDDVDDISDWLRAAVYLNIDSRNKYSYPTSGTFLFAELKQFYGKFGNTRYDPEFLRLFIAAEQIFPLNKRTSFSLGAFVGKTDTDNISIEEAFYLGGFIDKDNGRPFAGFNFAEVIAEETYIARLKLQFQPWDDKYLILRWDAGRVIRNFLDYDSQNFIMNGAALTLGWETPLGPVELSMMGNDQNPDDFRTYVSIGYCF
jgi:NTE family protein